MVFFVVFILHDVVLAYEFKVDSEGVGSEEDAVVAVDEVLLGDVADDGLLLSDLVEVVLMGGYLSVRTGVDFVQVQVLLV